MTDPPTTSSTTLPLPPKKNVTYDMRHRGGGVNILSKLQVPSSYSLERQCCEDISKKDDLLTELIIWLFVKTAPDKPGLSNTLIGLKDKLIY